MAKYVISAFADEYSKDFDIQVEMLKKQGITYIEPRFIGGRNISELAPTEVQEVKAKLDDGGIGVVSVGSPLGKITLDDDIESHLETARNVFEGANILGTDKVRVFSFYPHRGTPIMDSREEVIEKLGRMVELADGFGVKLCHENEGGIYGESPEACLDLLDTLGGKLRAVLDMGNFTLGGYDPVKAYRLLCPYIEYFHIKDGIRKDSEAKAIVPPGKGNAKIGEILGDYIKAVNRDVIVTLEPHLETFSGLNALTNSKFNNPYKFESKEAAFLCALGELRAIISDILREGE